MRRLTDRGAKPFVLLCLTGPHLKKKNSLGPRIKYYNSIDTCYSKKIVNSVEIRNLLFFLSRSELQILLFVNFILENSISYIKHILTKSDIMY